jgi:hypothetical protein
MIKFDFNILFENRQRLKQGKEHIPVTGQYEPVFFNNVELHCLLVNPQMYLIFKLRTML